MGITIKELSERAGVKIPTIRYYERQGLLPEPERTGAGQRRYGWVDVARLRFVRFGRSLGLEIVEIRALIEMVGEGNGEEIVVLADAVTERAEQSRAFCGRLRSVSTSIIAGEIDETTAFDLLVSSEKTQAVVSRGEANLEPSQNIVDEDQLGNLISVSSKSETEKLNATDLSQQENILEPKAKDFVEQSPVINPKRRRARAKA